jgi:hypothetical protein
MVLKAGYPRKNPKPISPFSKWPGPPPGHYIFGRFILNAVKAPKIFSALESLETEA